MLRWCPCDVVVSASHEHFADLRSSSLVRSRSHAKCSERQPSTPSSWCQYPSTSDYPLGCLCSVSSVFLWARNLAEARSRRHYFRRRSLTCSTGKLKDDKTTGWWQKFAVSKNIPACDRQIEKQTGHIARLHELFNFMGFVVSKKNHGNATQYYFLGQEICCLSDYTNWSRWARMKRLLIKAQSRCSTWLIVSDSDTFNASTTLQWIPSTTAAWALSV